MMAADIVKNRRDHPTFQGTGTPWYRRPESMMRGKTVAEKKKPGRIFTQRSMVRTRIAVATARQIQATMNECVPRAHLRNKNDSGRTRSGLVTAMIAAQNVAIVANAARALTVIDSPLNTCSFTDRSPIIPVALCRLGVLNL